jgi:hypothetical protein
MRLWLLLAAALPCFAQSPLYRIGGVVVHAVTGQPLSKTRVTVIDIADAKKTAFVITIGDGRFTFGVPEGRYRLAAERHGQDRQLYGALTLGSSLNIAVIAGPNQRTNEIVFQMIPNSSLSGRVTDEAGEPVEDSLVQLFRSTIVMGRRKVQLCGWVYTDDTGAYRFSRLPSGNYYLAASGQPWYSTYRQSPDAAQLTSMSYPLTFYPNTRDWRSASMVSLRAGDDATANLSLTATPGYNLTVQCDASVGSVQVSVIANAFSGADTFAKVKTAYCPSSSLGLFAPGSYVVRSSVGTHHSSESWSALQSVEIASSDVEVKMGFKPAPSVSGQIRLGDLKRDELALWLREDGGGSTAPRGVSADGSFAFPAVAPGTYRLIVAQPKDLWARQVLADGKTLPAGKIVVAEDAPPRLTVILERGLAHLTGHVLKAAKPVAGLFVCLVPKTSSDDPSDYGRDRTNSDGSFEMKAVRPGDYYLFAVEAEEVEYADRAAILSLLKNAKTLHVEANGEYKEDVEVP